MEGQSILMQSVCSAFLCSPYPADSSCLRSWCSCIIRIRSMPSVCNYTLAQLPPSEQSSCIVLLNPIFSNTQHNLCWHFFILLQCLLLRMEIITCTLYQKGDIHSGVPLKLEMECHPKPWNFPVAVYYSRWLPGLRCSLFNPFTSL